MTTATVHLFERFSGDWFHTETVEDIDTVDEAIDATGYGDCDASIDVDHDVDHGLTIWVRLR